MKKLLLLSIALLTVGGAQANDFFGDIPKVFRDAGKEASEATNRWDSKKPRHRKKNHVKPTEGDPREVSARKTTLSREWEKVKKAKNKKNNFFNELSTPTMGINKENIESRNKPQF